MKKTVFINLFFVNVILAYSQEYSPLISPGKTWKVDVYGWGNQHIRYTYGTPVDIDGQIYYPVLFENEADPGNLVPIAYLREDINTKKVFIYNGNSEFLLYDFDVVADQVISIYAFGYMHDITITSVETTLVNGESRIDVRFNDMGIDGRWIGGMGSIYGVPDATLGGIADYWPIVTCYYEENSIAWDNPLDETECDATIGITEHQASYLVGIGPNPARRDVFLSIDQRLSGQPLRFVIYSSDGREVFSELIFASDRTMVRLPLISSGLYSFGLLKDKDILHSGKLEIQTD